MGITGMRVVVALGFLLTAGAALAQSGVETVPVAPPASSTIIERAQPLGNSPNDLEVDEVTLAAVPALSTRLTGDTRRLQDLVAKRLREMAKSLNEAGIIPSGPAMAVFDQLANTNFSVEIMIPLSERPATIPQGLGLTTTPYGQAVRIIHHGDYDDIDATYDELSSFIEDRDIAIEDVVIERYMGEISVGGGAGTVEIIAMKR